MEMQRLYSLVRKGLDDYHLIEENDHIAIGLSGGKDSITLLYALAGLRRFYPIPFQISAIHVSLGFEKMDISPIVDLCKDLDVPFYQVETQIAEIVFQEREETNPCSLCAKMRKGALNEKAKELGCNKVAYGHHKDDIIETFMMSLIYEGRLHCFSPSTYLDKMELTVIRPMLYVKETEVIGFKNKYNIPIVKNTCPMDGSSKREYVKNLLTSINKESKGVKNRIFTAMTTDDISNWGLIK